MLTEFRHLDDNPNHGAKDPGLLYEPPFTDLHDEGLDGLFGDAGATKIIHLLAEIEQRAAV